MVVFVASNFAALCLYLVQTISNIFILRVLVHSRSMYRYGKFVSLNDKEIFDIVWQFRLFLYLYNYHIWYNNLNKRVVTRQLNSNPQNGIFKCTSQILVLILGRTYYTYFWLDSPYMLKPYNQKSRAVFRSSTFLLCCQNDKPVKLSSNQS